MPAAGIRQTRGASRPEAEAPEVIERLRNVRVARAVQLQAHRQAALQEVLGQVQLAEGAEQDADPLLQAGDSIVDRAEGPGPDRKRRPVELQCRVGPPHPLVQRPEIAENLCHGVTLAAVEGRKDLPCLSQGSRCGFELAVGHERQGDGAQVSRGGLVPVETRLGLDALQPSHAHFHDDLPGAHRVGVGLAQSFGADGERLLVAPQRLSR